MPATQYRLNRLINRALSLPRQFTTSIRRSLRQDPLAPVSYQPLVPDLADEMIKGYSLGYRRDGARLPNETRSAKYQEYLQDAETQLQQYADTSNAEFARTYETAIENGRTHRQATNRVVRRFGTLGFTAPAYNLTESLYRTGITAAYYQGVWDAAQADERIWGFQYCNYPSCAHPDDRVRVPTHSQYNLVTLPKSDPFWAVIWPPLEWQCRCRIRTYRRPQKIQRPPANPVPIEDGFAGYQFQL